jgi:hypothetical protein
VVPNITSTESPNSLVFVMLTGLETMILDAQRQVGSSTSSVISSLTRALSNAVFHCPLQRQNTSQLQKQPGKLYGSATCLTKSFQGLSPSPFKSWKTTMELLHFPKTLLVTVAISTLKSATISFVNSNNVKLSNYPKYPLL